MSEPLTRESRLINALDDIVKLEDERDTLRAKVAALEKQHAADLEAQQAAMLACIREERVSKQAERNTLRFELDNSERFLKIANDTNADVRAQLEWCESERNAARARCEQLEAALGKYGDHLQNCTLRWGTPSPCNCGFTECENSTIASAKEPA